MTVESELAAVRTDLARHLQLIERLQGDQFANADRIQRRRLERGEPANNDGYFYNTINRRFELKQAPNATTIAHEDTTGRTTGDHHSQVHPLSGSDHTGKLDHADLSGVAIVAKTSAYTATATDHVITCDASGGAITITLPAISGVAGTIYHIKKTDSSANAVTVDGNGSETIDGGTTATISTQFESIMIVAGASEWHII